VSQEEIEELRNERSRLEATVAAGHQSMQAMQDQIKALIEEKGLIFAHFIEVGSRSQSCIARSGKVGGA
jgi:RNA-binding protein YhbY